VPASAPTARRARRPPAQIRWDRVGRIAMLVVVGVLAYLYLSAGASIVSTWRSAAAHRAQVAAMERQNRQLRGQLARLHQPNTIVEAGRRLGMTRSGEVGFFETGLPNN
jgi:cell division protein FtsB